LGIRPNRQLDMATAKSRAELKQLAKKNDLKSARILAKEVVRANKQRDRLLLSKARVGSIQMQVQHQMCEWELLLTQRPH
jgi:charged multivesicular body protein 3